MQMLTDGDLKAKWKEINAKIKLFADWKEETMAARAGNDQNIKDTNWNRKMVMWDTHSDIGRFWAARFTLSTSKATSRYGYIYLTGFFSLFSPTSLSFISYLSIYLSILNEIRFLYVQILLSLSAFLKILFEHCL